MFHDSLVFAMHDIDTLSALAHLAGTVATGAVRLAPPIHLFVSGPCPSGFAVFPPACCRTGSSSCAWSPAWTGSSSCARSPAWTGASSWAWPPARSWPLCGEDRLFAFGQVLLHSIHQWIFSLAAVFAREVIKIKCPEHSTTKLQRFD